MRQLTSSGDPDQFFQRMRIARRRILLLDFDGTLAPFQAARDRVRVYPGVGDCLSAIMAQAGTRVVLVTGRGTDDLLPLLDFSPRPEIWGSHGWEHLLPDGTLDVLPISSEIASGLAEARTVAERQGLAVYLEHKPRSLALHVRGMPEERQSVLLDQCCAAWGKIAAADGLALQDFDGGLELSATGRTKGDVVRDVLAAEPADARVAYLGDDRTDEDAFEALGDAGLRVLVRPVLRPTAADLWLMPPEELLAFLVRWRDAGREVEGG